MPISLSGSQKVAVTLGDAAGVGPEVTLKAIQNCPGKVQANILLLGRASFYEDLAKKLKIRISFKDIQNLSQWHDRLPFIPCYFHHDFPKSIRRGISHPQWTALAVHSIELATQLAMANKIDEVVTPPFY